MPPAIKSAPYHPIGEFNFVGKKHKCSTSSTRESHSAVRAKKHIQPFHKHNQSSCLKRATNLACLDDSSPSWATETLFYVECPNNNCEKAKEALLKHVKESYKEVEDRELQSHSETMQFYHFHIIGNSFDTITRIREKHDVDMLLQLQGECQIRSCDCHCWPWPSDLRCTRGIFICIMQELSSALPRKQISTTECMPNFLDPG